LLHISESARPFLRVVRHPKSVLQFKISNDGYPSRRWTYLERGAKTSEVLELSLDGEVNNFHIADTIDIKDGRRHFEKINIGTLHGLFLLRQQGSVNCRRKCREG